MQVKQNYTVVLKGIGIILICLFGAKSYAQACNWWGTEFPLCQTATSGWGWENNASCISESTCKTQPEPYGVVGAAKSAVSQTASVSSTVLSAVSSVTVSSAVSSLPVMASSRSSKIAVACKEMCQWYQDAPRPLCQNQPSGWGWENDMSCIGRLTCVGQSGDGGIVELCESEPSSSSLSSVQSSSSSRSSLALESSSMSYSSQILPSSHAAISSVRSSSSSSSNSSSSSSASLSDAPMRLVNDNSGLCLGGESGFNVVQSSCEDGATSWIIDVTNDGSYRFANAESGKFLQIEDCDVDNGANVEQGEWRNIDCQKWHIVAAVDGWLELVNLGSNRSLDVANCTVARGGNVQQWEGLSNACQRWKLMPAKQAAIVNEESGKVLDVPYCNTDIGTNIQQYEWLNSPCQKWVFESSDAGFIKIKPTTNINACLTYEAGDNLIQGACSGTASDFNIVPLGDGTFSLASRDKNAVVDISNCSAANQANAQLYRWLDNKCQRFYLRDVTQEQVSSVGGPEPVEEVTPETWHLSGNLGTHDPTIIRENGVWWQFQTGRGIYGKRSSDGLNWEPLPSIFNNDLSWWRAYVPDHRDNDVWAPDIHAFNGRVWMYYSISTFGSRVSAIGLTSASSIAAGDWRDDGLVIASDNGDSYNAIDANLIITPNNEPWMVFGSWNDGIMLTAIDANTMKPKGRLYNVARRGGGIEGPTLIRRNGYYYLFVSVGRCCDGVNSTYQIRVGRSANISGPYLDRNGVAMLDGGGSLVKQTSGNWIGPGGQDIHEGVIAYHAYDANQNGSPFLRIETLGWDSEAWPYLR